MKTLLKLLFAALITIASFAFFLFLPAFAAAVEVNIDLNSGGRVFEGIGMVNSSGTSKLLRKDGLKQGKHTLKLVVSGKKETEGPEASVFINSIECFNK